MKQFCVLVLIGIPALLVLSIFCYLMYLEPIIFGIAVMGITAAFASMTLGLLTLSGLSYCKGPVGKITGKIMNWLFEEGGGNHDRPELPPPC